MMTLLECDMAGLCEDLTVSHIKQIYMQGNPLDWFGTTWEDFNKIYIIQVCELKLNHLTLPFVGKRTKSKQLFPIQINYEIYVYIVGQHICMYIPQ